MRSSLESVPGIDDVAVQKAEYVSRPTLGSLLARDLVWYFSLLLTTIILVVYFIVMSEPGGLSDGGGPPLDVVLVLLLSVIAGGTAVLTWRARVMSAFLSRGVEITARISGLRIVGDKIWMEYEYVHQGSHLQGRTRFGGSSRKKQAERLLRREIIILVDSEDPRRSLVLSKLA